MRLLISFQQNKNHCKNYLWLLIICLLAYWPLTFGIFSVKNDAIHYFLPYRFNISEAIRNGEWPFWSPYIYLGNPIYGDMQSGAWNPIVWLFSFIGRYDITLFHYENLLYIFLGGVGMFKLTNRLVQHSHTALLIAVSYMLSGFMLGGQLINWLAAAAFLPFVIHYYLKTLHHPSYANPTKAGIALFFLLTAGYPSFFILISYILLFLFLSEIIRRYKSKKSDTISWKRFFILQILIVSVFALLSLPAIISFTDLLPYYQRGGGTTYMDTISNSFEWQHLLSMFFPSSIKANDVFSSTDITCRNIYPGIFLLLVLVALPPKLNRRNILLSALALFALLFSLGDATPLRKLCYRIVPLMDTFRHPAQMRLLLLFAVFLLSAPSIKRFLENDVPFQTIKRTKVIAWILGGSILLITVLAFFNSGFQKQWIGFSFSQVRVSIKNIIDNITLADTVVMNGLIQLAFIVLFLLWLKKKFQRNQLFTMIWIANLFIMAQLILPISFVSKTSPKEINTLIHASPKGFPVRYLEKNLEENSRDAFDHFDKIALGYLYNKKIGISRISNSPSFLQEQDLFLNSDLLYKYISAKPVLYLADSIIQLKDTAKLRQDATCNYVIADDDSSINTGCSAGNTAIIKKISANSFEIAMQTTAASYLVLTQSYYHHWKLWIDGKLQSIKKVNTCFMGTPVPAGNHQIIFRFVPFNTLKALWVMYAAALLLIITWAVSLFRKKLSGDK